MHFLALSSIQSPGPAMTDAPSLLLGIFFGLMAVMAIYNLLLYFSLRDRAYLLYVGIVVFNILTTLATNGLSEQYFWPGSPGLDAQIYVTFAGISMAFSSRFAAVFLHLKEYSKRLDQLMWLIAALSVLMSVLTLFYSVNEILGFARWMVLLSFPTYIVVGWLVYRSGFKPALFYIIAWVPYILGVIIRTMHGAGWLPDSEFILLSIEAGGALEVVLLSLALADRIKGMRKEIAEKELEKEQFKTRLLEEQKQLLEQTVDERTKELQQANATKDKFFSIIAHDLRSPMVGLQGTGKKLEYFIRKNKQEKLQQLGGQIDESIDQLNHLLNNLLSWAATEMGSVPYHPEKVDLKQLVDENTELYASLAKVKSVTLINENQSLYAMADINMIATVIRNLLSNAIKFTRPHSQVKLSLFESGGMVCFSITDQGEGMVADKINALFGNHMASTRGTSGEKGFGLGLKLCKEFAEANGGSLMVESEVGQGTVFTLRLKSDQ